MTDQAHILTTIRTSCHTLLAHLESIPAPDAPLDEKQAWFETLCQLLGAHHLALGKIQHFVVRYGSLGFGYALTESLSSSEATE
mgnify:CR=1 FL=1